MAIWVIVYYSLNGDRSRFLPWAALFGGGAYTVASESIRLLDTGVVRYAHELIDKGYPWTPFLSTIWVTQRPATLGAAALLAAVCLVHSFVYGPEREGAERKSLYAGLLLATAPLVHTHLFLVGALYLLSLLGIQTVRASLPRKSLFCLILGLFPSILYLPWLIGKSGIIRVAGGWMQNEQTGFVTAFGGGMSLWWQNALPWLVLAAVGTALTKRYAAGAVLVMSFIFGNIFQIAIWNWDEIKIFLGIYLISIALWDAPSARFMRHAQWLLLFLMLPSLTELYVSLGKYERYTIYTADEVNLAARIRQATEPTAVIAAAPDHNSPVTLTGRKMFYGYEGTLSSHGIDFGNRQQMFQELDRLLGCRPDDINPCPDFLLWTERERRYWKRAEPGDNAEPTAVPELFRLLRGQSTGAAS